MTATRKPTPECRYWLYDPEGDGVTYYSTKEERDAEAQRTIDAYIDTFGDGWSDEVEFIAAGELTHFAQVTHKQMSDGTPWEEGMTRRGNYTLEPLKGTIMDTAELVERLRAMASDSIGNTAADEIEDLRALLAAVVEELDQDQSPGHNHQTPGVWDRGNRELAGEPCEWCATWAKVRAASMGPKA